MTGRTNFNVQVGLARRASLESLATGAGDCDRVILGVNSWLHCFLVLKIYDAARAALDQPVNDRRRVLISSS